MTFSLDPASVTKSTLNTSTSPVGGITTLGSPITTVDQDTITLASGTEFPTSGTIKIDSEYITYSGKTDNVLTGCVRGAFGTSATIHTSGTTVTGAFVGLSELNAQPNVAVSLSCNANGTLYSQFSNDGTTWSTFPVNGYTITANIGEFQTAIKLLRYYRTIFITSSNTQATTFNLATYYGQFGTPAIPLNQSIQTDATSTLTRSVLTGENPTNTFSNVKTDGYAFQTSTPLNVTTLIASTDNS